MTKAEYHASFGPHRWCWSWSRVGADLVLGALGGWMVVSLFASGYLSQWEQEIQLALQRNEASVTQYTNALKAEADSLNDLKASLERQVNAQVTLAHDLASPEGLDRANLLARLRALEKMR